MSSVIYPKVIYFVSKNCSKEWGILPQEINFYSMLFVEEGSANYLIDGEKYEPQKGDVLFIKPGSTREAVTEGMTCIGIDFTLQEGDTIELPHLIHWGDFEDFHIHFQDLKFEWLQQKKGFELKSVACLMLVLHKLMYENKQKPKNIHVELMKKFIMENHKQDLPLAMIAKEVSLSPVYCGALFKRVEKCTIAEFLTQVRINRAITLLETGEYSISETALESGFVDIYYFSNTFKKMVGISPSKYKNRRSVKITQLN